MAVSVSGNEPRPSVTRVAELRALYGTPKALPAPVDNDVAAELKAAKNDAVAKREKVAALTAATAAELDAAKAEAVVKAAVALDAAKAVAAAKAATLAAARAALHNDNGDDATSFALAAKLRADADARAAARAATRESKSLVHAGQSSLTETAPPPQLASTTKSPEREALEQAVALNEKFESALAWKVLRPFSASKDARIRVALATCNLYLAENALLAKQTSAAKEYAVEAVNQATAAIELDPQSSDARVWYGQTIQVRAKILEGGLGQARVCSPMVQSWDLAVELAPHEPLAYHLLGSFGFHTSALPWIAAQSMRSLSPGLRKFSEADALRLLLKSEELMTTPPKQYSLANKSLIGRLYLKKGEKAEARMWLDRALELAADTTIVFDYAKEEIVDDTKKARAKC